MNFLKISAAAIVMFVSFKLVDVLLETVKTADSIGKKATLWSTIIALSIVGLAALYFMGQFAVERIG
jgi:hypothetical protein